MSMNFKFGKEVPKEEVFDIISQTISSYIPVRYIDAARPWGGFFVIEEAETEKFIQRFFPGLSLEHIEHSDKMSPKLLVVAPGKRLSWQYHLRRSELWTVVGGSAYIITSDSDIEGIPRLLHTGHIIELKQGERHRLVGADNWAVIAEIWRHTDKDHPSDEEDIIRVNDDFGR